jgi:hypothetical protein
VQPSPCPNPSARVFPSLPSGRLFLSRGAAKALARPTTLQDPEPHCLAESDGAKASPSPSSFVSLLSSSFRCSAFLQLTRQSFFFRATTEGLPRLHTQCLPHFPPQAGQASTHPPTHLLPPRWLMALPSGRCKPNKKAFGLNAPPRSRQIHGPWVGRGLFCVLGLQVPVYQANDDPHSLPPGTRKASSSRSGVGGFVPRGALTVREQVESECQRKEPRSGAGADLGVLMA